MAIYHLSAAFVSRSTGRSAVQSAAYISGTILEETRRGIIADYRNRSADVVFTITLSPQEAPSWARELSVWDKLESYEDQYALLRYKTEKTQEWYKEHAQTAQTIVVALPKELTPDLWQELSVDFANERFVARGLVVSIAIHSEEGNPHAHLQISRRSINDKGEWSWAKDRVITTKAALKDTRKLWAEKVNFYLEREGCSERVTHQSYIDLGLPYEATKHEGWFAHKIERMGQASRIIQENRAIKDRNKERVTLEPAVILTEITSKKATFSALELARTIQARTIDDPKLTAAIYESAINLAIFVGSSLDGQARYTSQDYLDKEHEALTWSEQLSQQSASITLTEVVTAKLLQATYAHLNVEQQQAVIQLCQNRCLGIMIGRAGTGKTTTLQAVVDCHQQAGYQVIGLSLSAVAAENLQIKANVKAETIAFYLDKWQRLEIIQEQYWSLHPSHEHQQLVKKLNYLAEYELSKKHLIIIDEAGMVGTAQWHKLMYFAKKAGAKLIAIGDDHQFKAIEAGDFFRKLREICVAQICELKDIQRQKVDWMQEASIALANLKTYKALAIYENHHRVERIDNLDILAQQYTDRWQKNLEQTGLLLASTNAQCIRLNNAVRSILKERGLIATEEFYLNQEAFSVNDHITFLSNDRLNKISTYDPNNNSAVKFLIKNGTQGRILAIKALDQQQFNFELQVEINAHIHAKFYVQNYSDFKHSYALTLHKAQGKTVDWSYVLASRNMDAFATYVALTRHCHDTKIFYSAEEFADFKTLQVALSNIRNKDLVIDYTISDDQQLAWENIQEYKLLGQDLSATMQETNWESYNAIKLERNTLGKIILEEWNKHQNFARQAGLSFEGIAITCGLKMRPLSLAEIAAHDTVKQYADTALNARLVWRDICSTNPGKNCYQHVRYAEFVQLRQVRNNLAKIISANKPLHKPFVQDMSHLGVGWKTLDAQSKQKEFQYFARASHMQNTKQTNIITSEKYTLEVTSQLQQKIGVLARELLGEPSSKTLREWHYGNKGAISIQINGVYQGAYANIEAGVYGGPLQLIEQQLNLNAQQSYQWSLKWLERNSLGRNHLSINYDYINQITQKYSISNKYFHVDQHFITQAKECYQTMLDWYKILEISPSAEQRHKLLEKSVLAQAFKDLAKQEYCFGCSPLKTEYKSSDIAVIAAALIQDNAAKEFKIFNILKQAENLLYQQNNNANMMQAYKELYPNIPNEQLGLIVTQNFICNNHTGQELNDVARQKILSATNEFVSININEITNTVTNVIDTIEKQNSIKENNKYITAILEKQYIQQLLNNKQQTNLETLKRAANIILQTQTTLIQQRTKLLHEIKQLESIKENEMER